jgi:vacuolar-type H+-ATPase subunit H
VLQPECDLSLRHSKKKGSMATPSSVDTAVETAISRVLDAERCAHEDVDRATRNAAAIAETARATARAIIERNERRIRTLRTNFETRAQREVAAIEAEALDQDTVRELSPDDLVRAKRAVAALACELTGGTA